MDIRAPVRPGNKRASFRPNTQANATTNADHQQFHREVYKKRSSMARVSELITIYFDRLMFSFCIFLTTFYLIWRIFTVHSMYQVYEPHTMRWPMVFYVCEWMMFPSLLMFIRVVWNPRRRPYLDIRALEDFDEADYPTVNIMVPMYSESYGIVKDTVLSCMSQDYPPDKFNVIICDDGKNEECRAFATRHEGLEYVRRIKVPGVPHHAKAGNLNNVIMNHSEGDLMLVLDCDMIIVHDFLARAVGQFFEYVEITDRPKRPSSKGSKSNSRTSVAGRKSSVNAAPQVQTRRSLVGRMSQAIQDQADSRDVDNKPKRNGFWRRRHKFAFLQTPQEFYNLPVTDPMCHSSALFYGKMFQGFDAMGAAPCCGTGVMFARNAMLAVGGFSVGSITEDFNTAMTMHKNGWVSGYINERFQFGLAPDNIPDVYGQRLRWAMGTIQIMKQRGVFTMSGLKFMQRIVYWHTIHSYFNSYIVIFFLFSPILWYTSDMSPMPLTSKSESYMYILLFTTLMYTHRFMMQSTKKGPGACPISALRGEQNFIWCCPWNMLAIFKVLSPLKPPGFKVTDKEGVVMAMSTELKMLWPQWGYVLGTFIGYVYKCLEVLYINYDEFTFYNDCVLCFTVLMWQHYIWCACLTPIVYACNPQRVEREERLVFRENIDWSRLKMKPPSASELDGYHATDGSAPEWQTPSTGRKAATTRSEMRDMTYMRDTDKLREAAQQTQHFLNTLEQQEMSRVVRAKTHIVPIRPKLEHDWSTKWFSFTINCILGWYSIMFIYVVLILLGVIEDGISEGT